MWTLGRIGRRAAGRDGTGTAGLDARRRRSAFPGNSWRSCLDRRPHRQWRHRHRDVGARRGAARGRMLRSRGRRDCLFRRNAARRSVQPRRRGRRPLALRVRAERDPRPRNRRLCRLVQAPGARPLNHPRLAIPVIGGPHWLGGWNYMLNLVRVMAEFAPGEVDLLLFAGSDLYPGALAELQALPGVTLVQDAMFDPAPTSRRLARAIVTGVDRPALDLFRRHGVDVVFEAARFFGRRFPLPAIAWFPDFQHRRLPHLFPRFGRWRREIGFRAQIATGRLIMLSSAAAEADCLSFYPQARGRTRVVRFAVPADDGI